MARRVHNRRFRAVGIRLAVICAVIGILAAVASTYARHDAHAELDSRFDTAATLAMTATSMMDAAISCWDSKYTYLLVRPVTEIQKTTPGWMPSIVTPPFPAYVSGHSTFSAAAAVVLATLLPDRAEELLNAAAEAGDSRVYGGIHYWFDDMAGAVLGEKIADETLRKYGLELPTFAGPAQRLHFQNADARTQS